MNSYTILFKIKHTLKASDKQEAVETFLEELHEMYLAGELDGKIKISKSNKVSEDTDDEDDDEDDDNY